MPQAFSIKDALQAFWSEKNAPEGKSTPKGKCTPDAGSNPEAKVGRWHCTYCGFWNNPTNAICGGNGPMGCKEVKADGHKRPPLEAPAPRGRPFAGPPPLTGERLVSCRRSEGARAAPPGPPPAGEPAPPGEGARASGTSGGQGVLRIPGQPRIFQNHPCYKTHVCRYFLAKRGCRLGDQCTYIHRELYNEEKPAHASVSPSPGRSRSRSSPRSLRGRGGPFKRPGRSGGAVAGGRSRSRRAGGAARGRRTHQESGAAAPLTVSEMAKRQARRTRGSRSSGSSGGGSSSSRSRSASIPRVAAGADEGSRDFLRDLHSGARRAPRRSSASSTSSGRSATKRAAPARPRAAAAAPRAAEAAPPREGRPKEAGGGSMAPAASRWDVPPSAETAKEDMNVHMETLKKTAMKFNGVKTREVYIGNLPYNLVTEHRLRLALGTLFRELPAFRQTYPDVDDPIHSLTLHVAGMGAFAFVEFQDEMLASTAMLFSGFELCGRSAGMGRPQGYLPPPNGEAPALDVTPLRQRGLLPVAPSNSMCGKNQREGKLRELYFGNLVRGKTSPDVILKLIDPVAKRLAEWREQEGHAVTNVNVGPEGTYAFVQFQSIQLATKIMQIFDGQEVFGRVLRVRRTNTFEEAAKGELKAVEALQALLPEKVASTSRTAPFLMPPPPPGPPPEPAELPPEQLPLDAPPAPPEVQALGERQLLESLSRAAPLAPPPPLAAAAGALASEPLAATARAPPTAAPPPAPPVLPPLGAPPSPAAAPAEAPALAEAAPALAEAAPPQNPDTLEGMP